MAPRLWNGVTDSGTVAVVDDLSGTGAVVTGELPPPAIA
jgi:hypothetical protein